MTKLKRKQRDNIYRILKINDATNKASWWNIADKIVDSKPDSKQKSVNTTENLEDKIKATIILWRPIFYAKPKVSKQEMKEFIEEIVQLLIKDREEK